MKPEEVAQYLRLHPEFFEEYADMLAEMAIPHPHGGRAIPLSERQILSLREKSRRLEGKLAELIRFGEQNDAISDKLHRLTIALMVADSLEAVIHVVGFNLREDFAVPHVALRLWTTAGTPLADTEGSVHEPTRAFADRISTPHCGAQPVTDTAAWFGEAAAHLRSFAYVPLRAERTFGLLAMASEDAQRFYPEMGTLYLRRLGELVSSAVLRQVGGSLR